MQPITRVASNKKQKLYTMTSTTTSGREIKATANHAKRTFTIRVNGSKYRTTRMSREEFNTSLHMTANDWQQYLKGSDYYIVK